MAKTATVKIQADIEYTVIGNAFGLLIASGGLLAGTMVNQRSLEYWPDDLVPLILVGFMSIRLVRSFMAALLATQAGPAHHAHHTQHARKTVAPEAVAMGQLPPVPGYTTDQVLEEVAKRIEAKKNKAPK